MLIYLLIVKIEFKCYNNIFLKFNLLLVKIEFKWGE
jgi:hypothetical protein